jgi:exopolysaccharide production protein ExoY
VWSFIPSAAGKYFRCDGVKEIAVSVGLQRGKLSSFAHFEPWDDEEIWKSRGDCLSSHTQIHPEPFAESHGENYMEANEGLFPIIGIRAMWAKRCLDLALGILAAPMVVLLVLPICMLVMLETGSPLYRHPRVGRGGRIFFCYKIRTMALDADIKLRALLNNDELARAEWEAYFKLKDDPRVTRLGRFLRRTSLDELPQLWNVLKGEMSFVGPRPIIQEELPRYGERAAAYLACAPGISGLWQVSGRNDISYEERTLLDERYAREWTLAFDLWILLRTLPVVLWARGSY